jgi:hypothetical protein
MGWNTMRPFSALSAFCLLPDKTCATAGGAIKSFDEHYQDCAKACQVLSKFW